MTGAIQALLSATALASVVAPVSVNNRTVSSTGTGAATISVGYRLNSNGSVYKLSPSAALLESWLDSGTAGQFEVRATRQSGASAGSVTGTALSSWLPLSTTRDWSISTAAGTTKSIVLLVEIRDAATQTVQDNATITLSLVNTSGGGGGGGGGGTVSIDDHDIDSTTVGKATTASCQLNSDGNVYSQDGLLEAWLDSGASGDFAVRATLQSGTLSSGVTGSWQGLSSSQSWTVSQSLSGSRTATILIEIRDASSLTVLDSATVTLTAEVA